MNDSKIIDLFYARSERAIMELSAKYGNVCNKIAKNILNNILDAEECLSSSESVEAEISAKELTRLIDLFLDTLDAESRILFVRRYWYSCSISELAEQFRLKSNTVSVRLSRIRDKLRNYLKKIGSFSSLSGDDLSLSATYEGNGVVSVQVENRSNKELNFQSKLKLMRWSTSEEVKPLSGKVSFSNTEIPANSSGTMIIDLSGAYDMTLLETPILDDDWYYFVLTNNNFMFGQDWMCTVEFAEPIPTVKVDPIPITPVDAARNS